MENWLSTWKQPISIYQEVEVFFYVLGVGAICWLLNQLTMRLLGRIQTPWSALLNQVMTYYGTLVLWFIGLLCLNVYFVSNDHEHRLLSAFQYFLVIFIFARAVFRWMPTKTLARLIVYSIIPLFILNSFNLLESAISALDAYAINLGSIRISLYDMVRVIYFGIILFWVGRESNRVGKLKIRQQKHLDSSTKEIIAKLFEVGLYILLVLILLNIVGVNFTTLAVVGGAIGVGIGLGLQSIASNFISGIIILLDRSLSIGDFIELSDGRNGLLRELNLRAVTLETFDGKDIVVPNDVFFTEIFTNWTHKNHKQRYAIDFAVAYSTDLDRLFPLVKTMLAEHSQVLSGDQYSFEEQPDIEISGFGDNGIDLHIEFWMEAIDDGENRVGGDLLYSLWKLMKENHFEFPFPQREVRILKS